MFVKINYFPFRYPRRFSDASANKKFWSVLDIEVSAGTSTDDVLIDVQYNGQKVFTEERLSNRW